MSKKEAEEFIKSKDGRDIEQLKQAIANMNKTFEEKQKALFDELFKRGK